MLICSLVSSSCQRRTERGYVPVKVTIDKTSVKIGDEIHFDVGEVPDGWTGVIGINGRHYFAMDSKHFPVRATLENGFEIFLPNNVVVTVKDLESGARLAPDIRFKVTAKLPKFSLSPDADGATEAGKFGAIGVVAPPGERWTVSGVPSWMTITAGESGTGNGTVTYRIGPSTSNDTRSAAISVGDAVFLVTQQPASRITIPFSEGFKALPTPVYALQANGNSPTRWVIEDIQTPPSALKVTSEGPDRASSLVIERPNERTEAWKNQIYIPRIDARPGTRYRVSFWLKAQNPGLSWLAFEQGTAPYASCGLSERMWVPSEWTRFTFQFQGGEPHCEYENNRFTIRLGGLIGKIWISQFSIKGESVRLGPETWAVSALGGPGQTQVSADPDHEWSVGPVPEWIRLGPISTARGSGRVEYQVAENTSNAKRMAEIEIGDAILQVVQPSSPYIHIPFHENFSPPPATWYPEVVNLNSTEEPRSRWVLLDQQGSSSTIKVAPDAPDGGNALMVDRLRADKENWKTQIYLPRIRFTAGARYMVSLRVKAENPALIWLALMQATPPHQGCGLRENMWAGKNWKKYAFEFNASGQNCGADNNWLVIQAGWIKGKLWIADVSLNESR